MRKFGGVYLSLVQGFRVQRFSAAAGRRNGQFDRKRDFGLTATHTRIKKRISNTEYRMSNVEGRNSTRREPLGRTIIFMNSKDKATRGASACAARAIPCFEILRLDILQFCGLLFNPGVRQFGFQVPGVSLWPGGPTVGLEA